MEDPVKSVRISFHQFYRIVQYIHLMDSITETGRFITLKGEVYRCGVTRQMKFLEYTFVFYYYHHHHDLCIVCIIHSTFPGNLELVL